MENRKSNEQAMVKREEVLALDIATHCGYYSAYGSGT